MSLRGEPWSRATTAAVVAAYVELERRYAAGKPLRLKAVVAALVAGPCRPHNRLAVFHRLQQVAGEVERRGEPLMPEIKPRCAAAAWTVKAIRGMLEELAGARPGLGPILGEPHEVPDPGAAIHADQHGRLRRLRFLPAP